jgi:ferrochelatase
MSYDALIVLSFGGPERSEDVLPFLENVLRGRNVPRDRMLEVAQHYYHFGGRSPINGQNRQLVTALRADFDQHGVSLPVYWGNRNWHPFLKDAVAQMRTDGVRRALALITSAFASYSGCRQYLEDITRARSESGGGAPAIDKIRAFFNHPGFVDAVAARAREACSMIGDADRNAARLIFTAHSVPVAMAQTSPYLEQIREACRLVSEALGCNTWELAFQSRSGPPGQPWLEPDINDRLKRLAGEGIRQVVVVPIGFLSDHMEVVYDLDTEAQNTAQGLGIRMVRAGTVGTHPAFIAAIRELVMERLNGTGERRVIGNMPAAPDECAESCCSGHSLAHARGSANEPRPSEGVK